MGNLKKGGRPEVVLSPGDIAGPLDWYEWNGQSWTKHPLLPEVDHGHSLQVADFNGDGNLDIFCAEMAVWWNGTNPDSKTWIFYGDGKGNITKTELPGSEGIGIHESKVGDLDGDGDAAILHKPFMLDIPGVDGCFGPNEALKRDAPRRRPFLCSPVTAGSWCKIACRVSRVAEQSCKKKIY